VLIGYVANGTSTIRVGSGGIMLPNHSRWWWPNSSARWPRSIRAGSTSAGPRARHRPGHGARAAPTLSHDSADSSRRMWKNCRRTLMRCDPASACAPCRARGSRCRCGCSVPACSARSCGGDGPAFRVCFAFRPGLHATGGRLYRRTFRPSEQLDRRT
jgi:hypothetical protein